VSRSTIAGSALGHVLAIWLLFFLVPSSRIRAMPQPIQVALVNLPEGAFQPARGEPDAPTLKPEEKPTTAKEEPSRPEKNAIRPEDAKKPAPKRPTPGVADAPQVASAPMGVPGLSGDVSVDATDFAFTYYLVAVRNRIGQNWGAPGISTGGSKVRCVVYFKIDRLGRVSDVKLLEPSGVSFFDQSAVRAVQVSNPLPPLPAGYGEASLGVQFGFQFSDL
jgi:TonB family protein